MTVLAAFGATVLLLGLLTGLGFFLFQHQTKDAFGLVTGRSTPTQVGGTFDPLGQATVAPGLDGANGQRVTGVEIPLGLNDPLLVAIQFEPDSRSNVSEVRLLELASDDASTEAAVLVFFDAFAAPLSLMFDTVGRPSYLVTPEQDHLYLEYLPEHILVHFMMASGDFGVQVFPISDEIRYWLDQIKAGETTQRDKVRDVASAMSIAPASLVAAYPLDGYVRHDHLWQSSNQSSPRPVMGAGSVHVLVNDQDGKSISGHTISVEGCSPIPCHDNEVFYHLHYSIVLLRHPFYSFSQRSIDEYEEHGPTLLECVQQLERAQTGRNWLFATINLVASLLVALVVPEAGAKGAALMWAATTLPALGFSAGSADDCRVSARQMSMLLAEQEENLAAVRATTTARICVAHEHYIFNEPCSEFTYQPYFVPRTSRDGYHTFVGNRNDNQQVNEICLTSPDNEPYPLPVFAPADHEMSCEEGSRSGTDPDDPDIDNLWIALAVMEFEDKLISNGVSPEWATWPGAALHECMTLNSHAFGSLESLLAQCEQLVAGGQIQPLNSSLTYDELFPEASIKNEVILHWWANAQIATPVGGFVELVIDLPADSHQLQLTVELGLQQEDLAGCRVTVQAVYYLEGWYNPINGRLGGNVVGSSAPFHTYGACAAKEILEADQAESLRAIGLGPNNFDGMEWGGRLEGDSLTLTLPYAEGEFETMVAIVSR